LNGKPTFAEMFAGIGGFRLGLERAGWQCVWANEWDKYAAQTYRKNFGEKELIEGDIRDIDTDKIPNVDLLCGGFPCQSFSIAGKRKGTEEARGTLFAQIVRVASAKRPKILLLENVKGLLSSDDGRDFAKIIRVLGNLGYLLEWQVLNSKYFGVPQNRERVFIVGHLREGSGQQIFPVRSDGKTSDELQGLVSCTITGRTASSQSNGDYVVEMQRETQGLIQINNDNNSQVDRIYSTEGISPTVPTVSGGRHIPKIVQAMRFVRTDKAKEIRRQNQKNGKDDTPFGKGFRELVPSEEDVSGCVTGALNRDSLVGEYLEIAHCLNTEDSRKFKLSPNSQQKANLVIVAQALQTDNPQSSRNIRRLTPTECERLQGFPDGFTEGISDTQRYKCLGNAVTVNVIEFLGKQLLSSFDDKTTRSK
jgi:DNA (cytosine-5)-methyltransferase 1